MYTLYNLFKFVHVAAVIVWIGGMVTLGVINVRVTREGDRAALSSLSRQSAFFGSAIIAPAAVTTLIAGIVMVVDGDLGFDTLWIVWGLIVVVASILTGATLIRRAGEELSELTSSVNPDGTRVAALQSRLRTLNMFNLLLLFSAVWAMVFKPT
ncbi:MAG TPA: DUF2269 family protein [Actinomycetota bacterium]|nr:DUF2269 family protein [Actinomycetota bacterium]